MQPHDAHIMPIQVSMRFTFERSRGGLIMRVTIVVTVLIIISLHFLSSIYANIELLE